MLYRHELKYLLAPPAADLLAARLSLLCRRDAFAADDGTYTVRSLYLDDPYDNALREKLDGIQDRVKYRIRYYGANTESIMLEKKRRRDGLSNKSMAMVPRAAIERLLAGDPRGLLGGGDPLALDFYHLLSCGARPRAIVTYDREAFVHAWGNVRVTLDRRLRASEDVERFLDPHALTWASAPAPGVVLEVKYDAFLPDIIRNALQGAICHRESVSKYAHARLGGSLAASHI